MDDFSGVYAEADRVRRENAGDTVHLRAIIGFSNVCGRRSPIAVLMRATRTLRDSG